MIAIILICVAAQKATYIRVKVKDVQVSHPDIDTATKASAVLIGVMVN